MLDLPEEESGSDMFTDEEYVILVLSLLAGHGEDGASEDEILDWLTWCHKMRVANTTIDLVLKGLLIVRWDALQNDFVFTVSEAGRQVAEKLDG